MAAALEAKRRRRIVKTNMTRHEKTLFSAIGMQLAMHEVEPLMLNYQKSYEHVRECQDAYLKLVSEEDFDTEEEWFEEILLKYDENVLKINNFIKLMRVRKDRVVPVVNKRLKVKTGKADKPEFSGKAIDYPEFKKDFNFIYGLEDFSHDEMLYCLKRALPDKAKKWLIGTQTLKEAWDLLDENYGQPRNLSDGLLTEIKKTKLAADAVKFTEFFHVIHKAQSILMECNRLSDLDNSTMLAEIEYRLLYTDREKWARYQLDHGLECNLANLLQFMRREINIKRIAGAEIRGGGSESGNPGSSGSKSGRVNPGTGSVLPVSGEVGFGVGFANPPSNPGLGTAQPPIQNPPLPDLKPPGQGEGPPPPSDKAVKCWVCDVLHVPQDCVQFKKLSPNKRLELVVENKACFYCLRKHFGFNRCKRKKPCPAEGCKFKHDPLLHGADFSKYEKKVGATEGDVSDGDCGGVLPVVEAEILNSTGKKSLNASVFIDGGATLSLVKNQVAVDLGLKSSSRITLTITKIGAVSETYQTNLYPLYIETTVGRKKIVAAGIDEICAEVAHPPDIVRHFGFQIPSIEGICRKLSSRDVLLVSIDRQ